MPPLVTQVFPRSEECGAHQASVTAADVGRRDALELSGEMASQGVFDEKSRVRGRVLVAQEHQPLPSEQCLHVSAHTALQEPLPSLFSTEDTPDWKV
jgi:hypothetical protein